MPSLLKAIQAADATPWKMVNKLAGFNKKAYKGILPTKAFWSYIQSFDAHEVFNLSMA